MPFTPFHFGPALLVKSAAPRWFSFSAFVGVAVSRFARRFARRRSTASPDVAAEGRLGPALAGGLIGGLSHSVLDGIMHPDIRPFRPFTAANPLFELLSLSNLHLACVAMGFLGLIVLALRQPRRRKT